MGIDSRIILIFFLIAIIVIGIFVWYQKYNALYTAYTTLNTTYNELYTAYISPKITIVDSFCHNGIVDLTIMNIGIKNITNLSSIECTQIYPTVATCSFLGGTFPVQPYAATVVYTSCPGSGMRTCIYNISLGIGKFATTSIVCS